MRLGLIVYGSLDTQSGGYLYDRRLVEYLRRCGDAVEVISLPWRHYGLHLADNVLPHLINRLSSDRYDAILQDELNHPSLFIANRLAKRLNARQRPPFISIVHHLRSSEERPTWQKRFYGLIEGWYLRSVEGFIFNSQTTQAAVAQHLGRRSDVQPALVAYPAGDRFGPPLDPDRIRERATRPGPLKLLFVGNVIPRKGLHTLLEALALVPDGWELNVVGSLTAEPGYARQIQRRVSRHAERPARVRLHGAVSDLALAEHFSHSHLLAVPSTYEGFGIVYLEGMGFGLPAIATTAGGAWEIITPGQNGFLVDPNDAATLAGHLQALNADRARLVGLSLAARERFLAHPTWEQSAAQIRDFIQKMVSQ